jgi:isopenicillin-N epimerase
MTERSMNERRALDAVQEAEEKVHAGRREFFKLTGLTAAAAGAAGLGVPSSAFAYGGIYAPSFILEDGNLYMNIGTTGSTPKDVLRGLGRNEAAIAKDPLITFSTQNLRNSIAAGFGADPNEIVMSFNTTDGMSKIMAGLDLNPGDEIITTNMEHPGGTGPMNINRDRDGVVYRTINLPTGDAMTDTEVLARFNAARNGNTRAIVFSSPPFLTGTRLNEQQLCAWAAQNGLISIIDGAHAIGMINLNFHTMGVDFYAGSGHKWQCGPGQTGIAYVRNGNSAGAYTRTVTIYDGLTTNTVANVTINLSGYANLGALPRFWPTVSAAYTGAAGSVLAGGNRAPTQNVAATLMSIGNPSYPALKALQECCWLWDNWGRQNIENYIVALAQYLRSRLTAIWGPRCLNSAYDANTPHWARTGLTSFNPFSPGFDFNAPLTVAQATAQTTASGAAVTAMRTTHRVVVRNTNCPHSLRGNPGVSADAVTPGAQTSSHPLRISTHLFHHAADVDQLITALQATVPVPGPTAIKLGR